MLIHLMQHGACLSKDLDPNQPLSPVGREQIAHSAAAAKILGVNFELVAASPKLRSRQTAEIMAEAADYPASRIVVTEAVKAMAQPQKTFEFIKEYEGLDSIFIAGHLPSLNLLASLILTGGSSLDIAVDNGGLMQIAWDPQGEKGVLNWYLSPSQLTLIARN